MRLVATIKKITKPVKLAAKLEIPLPIEDKYKSPLSGDTTKNSEKWFDEVGLRGTRIKSTFINKCRGPRDINNPGQGSFIHNDEIAIRLFILMLFSDPHKILMTGPQTYNIPQSLTNEKGRADKALILVEENMNKEEGSKHHYDKPLNIKSLKEKYDPKNFFDEAYNYLKNNINQWSTEYISDDNLSKVKTLRDEGFTRMKNELSQEESEEYIKNIKENYLNELNEIIKYCEKTFKKEVQRGEVSIETKTNLTWKQTKALMADPKGDIRKYIAAKKWSSAFLSSGLASPYRKDVVTALGSKNPNNTSIYKNQDLFNYLYSNEDVRYNQTSPDNVFSKPEKFELGITVDGTLIKDASSAIQGIMDWVAANLRSPQTARRYYQGRELNEEDRITITNSDGSTLTRFPDEVWNNSEEVNYTQGEIIIYENIPMGLAMFNMDLHNPTSGSNRRFQHPTQFEIEKMVADYTFSDMRRAESVYHNFLTQFRDSQLNYEETNSILVDYRGGKKLGYYWVDLNTTYSEEESGRMGHCGRDSFGDLFSLRSMEEDKSLSVGYHRQSFWRGTSWLTIAINKKGHIRQLKTLKNARPKDRNLLEKIVDLLTRELSADKSKVLPFNSEPLHKKSLKLYNGKTIELSAYSKPSLIQPCHESNPSNPGFDTTGYQPHNDFHISDLPDDLLKRLYEARPDFFAWKGTSEETRGIENRLTKMYETELLEAEKAKEEENLSKQSEEVV